MSAIFRTLFGHSGQLNNQIYEPLLPTAKTDATESRSESAQNKWDTQLEGGGNFDKQENTPDGSSMPSLDRCQIYDLLLLQKHFKKNQLQGKKFFVFEPKGINQKLKSCEQNLHEAMMVCAVALCAILNPSVISSVMVFVSLNLLITSKLEHNNRFKFGLACGLFNLICLVAIAFQKYRYFQDKLDIEFVDKSEDKRLMDAIGVSLNNQNRVDINSSFTFEFLAAIVFVLGLQKQWKMWKEMKNLEANEFRVNLIKIFELPKIKEEKIAVTIGSSQEEAHLKEKQREAEYEKEMNKQAKMVKRYFVNCKSFVKTNKLMFWLMSVFKVMESMIFNGVCDIPVLVMMFVIFALYSLRKNFYYCFNIMVLLLPYLLISVIILKIQYLILSRVSFINHFIKDNGSDSKVRFLQIMFGIDSTTTANSLSKEVTQITFLILGLFFTQTYLQSKWAEYRQVISKANMENQWFFKKYIAFLMIKRTQKEETEAENQLDKLEAKKEKRYKKSNLKRHITKYMNFYLPIMTLWTTRALTFYQICMYHNLMSLFHMIWFVFSFLLPLNALYYFTITLLVPVYTLEMVLVYGSQIKVVMEAYPAFRELTKLVVPHREVNGKQEAYFENNMVEQSLFFMNLLSMVMMISSFKEVVRQDFNSFIYYQIASKIEQGRLSMFFFFLFLKNSHFIVLLYLLNESASNLDSLEKVIFVLCFIIYSQNENMYRKTSKFLMLVLCYELVLQLFFSLFYREFPKFNTDIYDDTQSLEERRAYQFYAFWEFMQYSNRPNWTPGQSVYFRWTPKLTKVYLLLALNLQNTVNLIINTNSQKINEQQTKNAGREVTMLEDLESKCKAGIQYSFPNLVLTFIRISNFIYSISILTAMSVLIYLICKIKTSVISFILFLLNVVIICFIIKGDAKQATYKNLKILSQMMFVFTLVVMLMFLCSICLLDQVVTEVPAKDSMDYVIWSYSPSLYDFIDYLGVRIFDLETQNEQIFARLSAVQKWQAVQDNVKKRFLTLIAYFIISGWMTKYFDQQLKIQEDESLFMEEDYAKLFNFKSERIQLKKNETFIKSNTSKLLQDQSNLSARIQESLSRSEKNQSNKFVHKSEYDEFDFLQHYEDRRYTTPFLAYRLLNWWPYFDFFATYGHLATNFTIVWLAVSYNLSIYSFINILCVGIFYTLNIVRLQARAAKSFRISGILDQTDLKNAQAITKQYKMGALFEFLTVRMNIWRVQIVLCAIFASIAFVSTLLDHLKLKKNLSPEQQQKIDDTIFYLFVGGCYKNRTDDQSFYVTYGVILLCLTIEKQSINWLTDRFGCNYNRLQKFLEMDLRKQCLEEGWPKQPNYDPNNYRYHYFFYDMPILLSRFCESENEQLEQKKKALKNKQKQATFNQYAKELQDFLEEEKTHFHTNSSMKEDHTHGHGKDHHLKESCQEAASKDIQAQNALFQFQIRNFIPIKVAYRVRDFITFTLKVEGQSPELKMTKDEYLMFQRLKYKLQQERRPTQTISSETKNADWRWHNDENVEIQFWKEWKDYFEKLETSEHEIKIIEQELEYENIYTLREYKKNILEKIIADAISMKYKISLSKGMQLVLENFVLMFMMVSIILKANIISLIYLVFIIKYLISPSKTILLVRATIMIALFFVLQYGMFVFNLTSKISPQSFPTQFGNYPTYQGKDFDAPTKYAFPILLQYPIFHDLQFSMFIGLGLQSSKLIDLVFDFLNLFVISMYIMNFRNPLFVKSVHKVFWQFPAASDKEQLARCTPQVQKQLKWMSHPQSIDNHKFLNIKKMFAKDGKRGANDYYQAHQMFEYFKIQKIRVVELNEIIVNYIDLKFNKIWSNQFIKEVKWSFKNQDPYFRLVKQGSVLMYLTFHVFTIFSILLLALLRQSLLGFCYVVILLSNLPDASNVLNQRLFSQNKELTELKDEIEMLEKTYSEQNVTQMSADDLQQRDLLWKDIVQKKLNLKSIMEKLFKNKSKEQKEEEIALGQKEWGIIKLLQNRLLIFACLDFSLQVIAGMPQFDFKSRDEQNNLTIQTQIGIRKIWELEPNGFDYTTWLTRSDGAAILNLNTRNLIFLCLNCFMISILSLQSQIFDSFGYKKFVNVKGSSLDLYMNLADVKAKCLTYIFNNQKIREIFKIQTKKELVYATVEELKVKMIRWRQFTSTTLDTSKPVEKISSSIKEPLLLDVQRQSISLQSSSANTFSRQSTKMQRPSVQFETQDEVMTPYDSGNKLGGSISKTFDPYNKESAKKKSESQIPLNQRQSLSKSKVLSSHDRLSMKKVRQSVKFEEPTEPQAQPGDNIKVSKKSYKEILQQLSKEFVNAKMKKVSCCTSLYLYINKNYVNQIMFMNRDMKKAKLFLESDQHTQQEFNQTLYSQYLKGEVSIPTEYEQIMQQEVINYIEDKMDNRKAFNEFKIKFIRYKKQLSGKKSLHDIFELDKELKLKDLKLSWQFSRFGSMILKVLESFLYALISNTDSLIYISCFLSMYENAGLLSLFYPFYILGYGLLEESRPSRKFWSNIYTYTLFIMVAKLLTNLTIFDSILQNPTFVDFNSYVKLGLEDREGIIAQLHYLLPEMLILSCLILNEIQLRLTGLYFVNENDIEMIKEGIQRNLLKGNLDEIKIQMALNKSNVMCLYFLSLEEHIKMEEKENQIIQKEDWEDYEDTQEPQTQQEARHNLQLNEIKNMVIKINKASREFDIDDQGNQFESFNDKLIRQNVIQKSLESDNFIFVEGSKLFNPEFLADQNEVEEIHIELEENQEVVSAGDFDKELEDKLEMFEEHHHQKPGVFENSVYFQKIFPPHRIQKPGQDYYLQSTVMLGLIWVFVFVFFSYMTVDQNIFLKNQNNNIFQGQMVLVLIFVTFVIIVERYCNRSDTKEVFHTQKMTNNEDQKFFDSQNFFRQQTARSMSVKIQTMKTADMDFSGNDSMQFLSTINEEANSGFIEQHRTIVTKQQKIKYVMHMFLLVVIHVYIFWFVPIQENIKLYGTPQCNTLQQEHYGCKNFKDNPALKAFYILWVLFLVFSALQLRKGFPNYKIASSVLSVDNCWGKLGADIYCAIPFALELRGLMDYTFSKTSLDIFQFWQHFQYHKDLYGVNISNRWYTTKIVGADQDKCEKFQCGWLMTGLVLILLIGPLYFFSDYSDFVGANPVLSGSLSLSIVVRNFFDKSDEFNSSTTLVEAEEAPVETTNETVAQFKPYLIWQNNYLTFRNWDEAYFKNSSLNKQTETRFFNYDQVQDAIGLKYSDTQWLISQHDRNKLGRDIIAALDLNNNKTDLLFMLDQKYTRERPYDTKVATNQSSIGFNFSKYTDCKSKEQLETIFNADCTKNPNFEGKAVMSQAYFPYMILGASDKADPVIRETNDLVNNQKKDLIISFKCPDQWAVMTREKETIYNATELKMMETDSKTCKLLTKNQTEQDIVQKIYEAKTKQSENQITLTLLSMLVSASFLASLNVTTFYTTITIVVFYQFRIICVGYTYLMWIYETCDTKAIIKLCEAIYLKRHEVDLVGEEECYRMLCEIIRQPELLRVLSGTHLRGSCGPEYDNLNEKDKKKIMHLDNLERKGFDVAALREKILEKYKK